MLLSLALRGGTKLRITGKFCGVYERCEIQNSEESHHMQTQEVATRHANAAQEAQIQFIVERH